jgi:type II secretory pathway predicted ATPase ExeA
MGIRGHGRRRIDAGRSAAAQYHSLGKLRREESATGTGRGNSEGARRIENVGIAGRLAGSYQSQRFIGLDVPSASDASTGVIAIRNTRSGNTLCCALRDDIPVRATGCADRSGSTEDPEGRDSMTDTGSSRCAARPVSPCLPTNPIDCSSRRGHAISPAADRLTAESQFMIPAPTTSHADSHLLALFGLREPPFAAAHTGWIRLSSREPVVGELVDALASGRGIAVLVGPPGSGKSAVCEEVSRRLAPRLQVVRLTDAACTTRRALLQAILFGLGAAYVGLTEQESRLKLFEHVAQSSNQADGIVIIAEEAERLSDRILEELRSLANFAPQGAAKIRVLLVGDESLEDRLLDPSLAAINQRIVCQQVLGPITQSEAARFIDERIQQAGGDGWEHVFTRPAMELVCLACDGSPRSLCVLADRCLKLAARRKESPVEETTVRTALEQLAELPMHWQIPSRLAGSESATIPHDSTTSATWESSTSEFDHSAAAIEFGASSGSDEIAVPESVMDDLPPASGAAIEIGMIDKRERDLAAPSACVEYGASDDPVAASPDIPVEVPALSPAVAAQSSTGWQEIDVNDQYAWLDEPRGAVSIPLSVNRTVIASSARDCAAEMAEASPPGFADELEDEILEQIHTLRATVARRTAVALEPPVDSSPAESAPASEPGTGIHRFRTSDTGIGMVPLPEWDVIQPEWLHRSESFQPVAIDVSHDLADEIALAAVPQTVIAPQPALAPAVTLPIALGPFAETIPEPSPSVPRTPDAADIGTKPVIADVPAPAPVERWRPYERLFSRLRRRQADIATRDAG